MTEELKSQLHCAGEQTLYKGFQRRAAHLFCIDYDFGPEDEIVGKTFDLLIAPTNLQMCNNGFHACNSLWETNNYYRLFNKEFRFYKIKVPKAYFQTPDKFVFSKFTVLEECVVAASNADANTPEAIESIRLAHHLLTENNTGSRNMGELNSGSDNVGSGNTNRGNHGRRNAGAQNFGNYNTGCKNVGSNNAGHDNEGDANAGSDNKGSHNTGCINLGDRNSGSYNTGDGNSGDSNIGHRNSGDWNIGNYNTGFGNLGEGSSNVCDVEDHPFTILGFRATCTREFFFNNYACDLDSAYMKKWREVVSASEREFNEALDRYFKIRQERMRNGK